MYIYGSYICQVDTFVRLHDKNSRSGARFEVKEIIIENRHILKQIQMKKKVFFLVMI